VDIGILVGVIGSIEILIGIRVFLLDGRRRVCKGDDP